MRTYVYISYMLAMLNWRLVFGHVVVTKWLGRVAKHIRTHMDAVNNPFEFERDKKCSLLKGS